MFRQQKCLKFKTSNSFSKLRNSNKLDNHPLFVKGVSVSFLNNILRIKQKIKIAVMNQYEKAPTEIVDDSNDEDMDFIDQMNIC